MSALRSLMRIASVASKPPNPPLLARGPPRGACFGASAIVTRRTPAALAGPSMARRLCSLRPWVRRASPTAVTQAPAGARALHPASSPAPRPQIPTSPQPAASRQCSSAAAAGGGGGVDTGVIGMPRYPDATPMGVLRGLDYFGTVVFACTGSITAASTGMDVFGCMILGTVTAVGGGTLRDVLVLGRRPFWSDGEPEYFSMSLAAAALAFFLWPTLEDLGCTTDDMWIFFADAVGVGAFCVIGAKNGLKNAMHPIICMACGVMTATFGGLVRDTLAKRPARILHSHGEIYATTALAGAAAFLAARRAGLGVGARVAVGVGTAVGMRCVALFGNVKLPAWEVRGGRKVVGGMEASRTTETPSA